MDEDAQMLTLEATMAALILVTASLFLVQFVPAETVDEGADFSRVQLAKYGQDAMTMATTKSLTPSAGFKLNLYREWNATGSPPGDDEKWKWDENGSDGHVPEIDENISIYDGVGEEWTDDHLVINYSSPAENTTVWFASKPRGGKLGNTSAGGTLWRLVPYETSSKRVEEFNDTNRLIFEDPAAIGRDASYGANMVWFESDSGEVGNPMFFWLNATPDAHDGNVRFNNTKSQGESVGYWKARRLSRRQRVVVDVDTNQKLRVAGATIDGSIREGEEEGGVKVTELGDLPNGRVQYEVYFSAPALGGYSIAEGPQGKEKWSDPVFVIVGQAATVGNQITPLDNVLNPVKTGYFSRSFEPMLSRVLPRNVDYRFAVYALNGEGGEEVVYNSAGEKLESGFDDVPLDPVVVNRFIATSNGSRTDVYNARLTLWYK